MTNDIADLVRTSRASKAEKCWLEKWIGVLLFIFVVLRRLQLSTSLIAHYAFTTSYENLSLSHMIQCSVWFSLLIFTFTHPYGYKLIYLRTRHPFSRLRTVPTVCSKVAWGESNYNHRFLEFSWRIASRTSTLSNMASNIEPSPAVSMLAKLLETGDNHDFVLHCGDQEFKVHKAIISYRSSFFRKLTSSSFKVQFVSCQKFRRPLMCKIHRCWPERQEAEQGHATIRDTDAKVLAKALEFLYTAQYDASCESLYEKFLLNIRLYSLAIFLDVPPLQLQAHSVCCSFLTTPSWPAACILPCIKEIFASSVNTGHDTLRTDVVVACVENEDETRTSPELVELLEREEPMAWTVGCKVRENADERMFEESKKVKKVQEELDKLRSNVVSWTKNCPHCFSPLRRGSIADEFYECTSRNCFSTFDLSDVDSY